MTIKSIIDAQVLDDFGISYFEPNEYNKLDSGMAIVSVTTKSYGSFRFKCKADLTVEYIKEFVKDYIETEISKDCGVVKFNGKFILIT